MSKSQHYYDSSSPTESRIELRALGERTGSGTMAPTLPFAKAWRSPRSQRSVSVTT
jgi:hypothetical protein